ncbi:MAG: T9SS type A sorting domain-containing protein [Bacteroidales bacterium]|nr:T9SS type A sorting domain-containing protein [Bacteroidales bacterium]
MKKIIAFSMFILGVFANNIMAEDTIRVMQYNLLYYGKQTDWCTTSNNNIDNKNGYLQTIIEHVKPDIFAVNELDGDGSYPVTDDAQYLLDNALNVNGVSHYKKTESPSTFLANIIFYNSHKLILKSSHPISFHINGYDKVFNAYKFYFNSDDLETTNDTAFLYCVVAHLKSSDDLSSRTQRAYETSLIMDYFESIGEKGNYLVMGDFNVYSPTEECFQNFIDPDNSWYTFNDPSNQIGDWSSNYDYRYSHTQSTHSSAGCHASGGMDDRFDFILASDYIMNGTDHFEYISNSYKAVGQDGSNYNGSLNVSSNAVVPNTVAQALYNMSDHLPVYLEMKVDQNLGAPLAIQKIHLDEMQMTFNNPVYDYLNLNISISKKQQVNIDIISVNGQVEFQEKVNLAIGNNKKTISVIGLESGVYIVRLYKNNGQVYASKFIKN